MRPPGSQPTKVRSLDVIRCAARTEASTGGDDQSPTRRLLRSVTRGEAYPCGILPQNDATSSGLAGQPATLPSQTMAGPSVGHSTTTLIDDDSHELHTRVPNEIAHTGANEW